MSQTIHTHHSFSIELASLYGIEQAILIHHFQHWIKVNRRLKRNFIEGRWWSYQTIEEIAAHFPYWNIENVRRYLESLRDKQILKTGNFNKISFDRTLWYAFEDEQKFIGCEENSNNSYERQICQMEKANPPNRNGEIARPIPDTKTDTKKTPPIPSSSKAVSPQDVDDASLKKSFEKAKLKPDEVKRAIKYYKSSSDVKKARNPIGFAVDMIRKNEDKKYEEELQKQILLRKRWAQNNCFNNPLAKTHGVAKEEGYEIHNGEKAELIRYDEKNDFWERLEKQNWDNWF